MYSVLSDRRGYVENGLVSGGAKERVQHGSNQLERQCQRLLCPLYDARGYIAPCIMDAGEY